MQPLWTMSFLAQWIVLIVLALAVLRLSKAYRGNADTGRTAPAPSASAAAPASAPTAIPAGSPIIMAGSAKANSAVSLGDSFPNLTVQSLAGGTEELLPAPGRQRLLVFTHIRCPGCEQVYPYLQQLQEAAAVQNPALEILLLMVADSGDQVRFKLAPYGFRFRTVFMYASQQEALPITMTPFGVVVDGRNVVQATGPIHAPKAQEILTRVAGLQPLSRAAALASYVQ